MKSSDPPDFDHLSEEEAARLWQRAAQLQMDASRRAELGAADTEEQSATNVSRRDGYQVQHVRAAAIEAGIGAEYLDAALRELRAERGLPKTRTGGALARRFLNDPPDAITVRRVIEATPAEVLGAMEEVFPHEPYSLSLIERHGDPLDGGDLVFDIVGASIAASGGFTGQVSGANMRQVLASIRPLDETGSACELTLRGPIAWAHRINTGLGGTMVGLTAGVGGLLSWKVAGAMAGGLIAGGVVGVPVAAAIAATVAAGGTLAVARGTLSGFRAIYGYSLGQGRQGLDSVLSAVTVQAQGGWKLTDAEE